MTLANASDNPPDPVSSSSFSSSFTSSSLARLSLGQRAISVTCITIVVWIWLIVSPTTLPILIILKCVDEVNSVFHHTPDLSSPPCIPTTSSPVSSRILHSMAVLLITHGAQWGHGIMLFTYVIVCMSILILGMYQVVNGSAVPSPTFLTSIISSCFIHTYITLLFSHTLLLLHILPNHKISLIVYIIFVTAGGENGALIGGFLWGKHHPIVLLSPHKTTQGFIGQLTVSVMMSIAMGKYLQFPMDMYSLSLLGLIIGIFGTLGDLFESLLKRCYHIKDVGALLPGTGGLLDRMDGLMFTFPITYYVLRGMGWTQWEEWK